MGDYTFYLDNSVKKYLILILVICLAFYSCDSNENTIENKVLSKQADAIVEKTKSGSGATSTNIRSDFSVYFSRNAGIYWYSYFVEDFGNIGAYSPEERSRHSITNSKTLRVKLLKDKIGQAGGAICDIKIANGEEYIISYKIKFQDGFEWAKGGKLPGLGGGKVYAGGSNTANGDGWSFRPVWHYYEGVNNNKPFLSPYAYYVDQPKKYGDEFGARYTISDNAWYNIWIHIKMNTGTNNDGKIHMKVNNSTVYYDSTFRWVTQDAGREIDELMWDIFRGGATSEYKASKDNYIYFDSFVIDKQ